MSHSVVLQQWGGRCQSTLQQPLWQLRYSERTRTLLRGRMRIAKQGINLLVHGKSASAFVAWNKASAESNDHMTLPFVGAVRES